MSNSRASSQRAFRTLRASALFVSMAMFGLIGCSSGGGSSTSGGSTGKSSAGQSGSSGGASGGQSSQGASSSSKGGSSGSSSSISGGSSGQSSGGISSQGGSSMGGGSSSSSSSSGGSSATSSSSAMGGGAGGTGGKSTGGTGGATGGDATGGRSQGGQDGGAGSGSTSSSPDAGVDRTPDTATPDGGSAGAFCPSDGTACKIMAMGDSITDGVGSSGGGYRVPLFKLGLTDSKNITFVGRNINGPTTVTVNGQTKQFPQGHEGYSGWTIKDGGGRSGIYNKVDGAMQTNMPHIITLMIGTNDVNINLDLANAPNRLGELLDKIIQDAPKALIVVAKLVPTTNDGTNGRVRTYNSGIEPIVQSRISQGKNLKMVDMYAAFTANTSYKTALMADELHPKDAGYSVMAQTWYDAIKPYLH